MNPLAINFYVCPGDVHLPRFVELAARAGARAVGLTVRALGEMDVSAIRALLDGHGLAVSSLNSAGYFLFGDAGRAREQEAMNLRLIEAAAELGARTLVVIAGGIAHGDRSLEDARARVAEGVAGLAERAARHGLLLGLEPIHPLGILHKGCINSIGDALALAAAHDNLGITLDFFHSWWDTRFGTVCSDAPDKLRLVQFCNVVAPDDPADFRRDLPATGLIDMAAALGRLHSAGYDGYFEFEMFPEHLRGRAVDAVIAAVGEQYAALARDLMAGAK